MTAKKSAEYLAESEGYIDITLAKPADIDGASLSVLRMREPLVDDQLSAQDAAGDRAAMYEITLMANLLEISVESLRKMTSRNYRRVTEAYGRFTD
jgi:hypothetical protein